MSIKPAFSYLYDQYDEVTFWKGKWAFLFGPAAGRLFISEWCWNVKFLLCFYWTFFIPTLCKYARFISEPIISFISYFMCSPGTLTWLDAKGKAFFQNKAVDLFERMHLNV